MIKTNLGFYCQELYIVEAKNQILKINYQSMNLALLFYYSIIFLIDEQLRDKSGRHCPGTSGKGDYHFITNLNCVTSHFFYNLAQNLQ